MFYETAGVIIPAIAIFVDAIAGDVNPAVGYGAVTAAALSPNALDASAATSGAVGGPISAWQERAFAVAGVARMGSRRTYAVGVATTNGDGRNADVLFGMAVVAGGARAIDTGQTGKVNDMPGASSHRARDDCCGN